MNRHAMLRLGLIWLAVIAVAGQIRFPVPVEAAIRGLDAAGGNALPILSPGGAMVMLETWATIAWAVIVIVAAQGACLAAGHQAGGWMAGARLIPGRLTEWLIGASVLALALFGLALTGLFDRVTLALVSVALLWPLGGFRAVRSLVPESAPADDVLARVARAAALFALGVVAVTLACPETGIDSLVYHLAVPARMLRLHRLVAMPSNFLHTAPMPTELLRGWTLALGGEAAARLWGAAALAAGGVAMADVLILEAGAAWGWITAALWISSPWLADLARAGKPDLWLAPLSVGAAGWLWRPGRSSRSGIVAGVLLGIGVCAKPASTWVIVMIVPALLLNRRLRLRTLVWAGLGASAMIAGWAVRSALLTGDPVYPFGSGRFGMPADAVAAMLEYSRNVAVRGHYATWLERLASPWTATFTDALPAVWLATVPLAVLATRPGHRARGLVLAGAIGWVVWLAGPPQLRYALPALAWLFAAAVLGLASAARTYPRVVRTLAGAVVAIQTVHGLAAAAASSSVLAGTGLEEHTAYAMRTLGPYAEMTGRLADSLPSRARVLYIGERRAYPAPRDTIVPSVYEPFPLLALIHASASPDDVQRRIRQLGVTYLVHNHVGALFVRELQTMNGWTARDLEVWAEYWRRHARLLTLPDRLDQVQGGYYVYRIAAEREAPLPTPTLPGVEGLFASIEARLRRGDLQAVAEQAATLEQIAGDFAEVKYFLGRVIYARDPWQAAAYLKAADAGEYRDLELWAALARRAEDQWRLDEALSWHRQIHEYEPRAAIADYRRVLGKLIGGARTLRRPEEAERYLRMALTITPDDASLWSELAEILLWLDRKGEAMSAMEEAVRLNPQHPGYRGTLGHMMRAS